MSLEVMVKVWKLDLPQPLKLLALALADWADDYGGDVRPSMAYTAWKVGASVRTVQRQMRTLEALGIVEVVDEKGYKLKSTGQWVKMLALHPEKGVPLPDWADVRGDNMTPPYQERDDRPRGQGVTRRPKRGDKAASPNTPVDTQEIQGDFQFQTQNPRLPGESPTAYFKRLAELGS